MKTTETDEARLDMGFRLVTARKPTSAEQGILLNRLQALRDQYIADPEEAVRLMHVGESARDEQLDAVEHAAFTGLCTLLLNLDEAITKS
jgi:hypothetical protein